MDTDGTKAFPAGSASTPVQCVDTKAATTNTTTTSTYPMCNQTDRIGFRLAYNEGIWCALGRSLGQSMQQKMRAGIHRWDLLRHRMPTKRQKHALKTATVHSNRGPAAGATVACLSHYAHLLGQFALFLWEE